MPASVKFQHYEKENFLDLAEKRLFHIATDTETNQNDTLPKTQQSKP